MIHLVNDSVAREAVLAKYKCDFDSVPYIDRPGTYLRSCNFPNEQVVIHTIIDPPIDMIIECCLSNHDSVCGFWCCHDKYSYTYHQPKGSFTPFGEDPLRQTLFRWFEILNPDEQPDYYDFEKECWVSQ